MSVELFQEIREAARPLVGREAIEALQRAMQNTLSVDVLGLVDTNTLAQILTASAPLRPIVESSQHVDLTGGKLRYPKLTSKPTAIEQSAEKIEGGTAKFAADRAEVDARTFSSGGDLSWQATRWSTPNLLESWMTLAAQSYARATEIAAAEALVAGTTLTGSVGGSSLADWVSAITTAQATIQLASDFLADALYADPTSAARLLALVYGETPSGSGTIAGLRVISSSGLSDAAPVVIVGYSRALLSAETPGAPIELRAVEPAIGGMEVGVIGAFCADVADATAFVKLT